MSTDSLNNSLINLCGGRRLEIEIQSEIFFLTRIWQIRFKRPRSILAFQQIDSFSCIIASIDLQVTWLQLEKAADLSLESEDKDDATRKWVWIYAFIIGAIGDNINVKKKKNWWYK